MPAGLHLRHVALARLKTNHGYRCPPRVKRAIIEVRVRRFLARASVLLVVVAISLLGVPLPGNSLTFATSLMLYALLLFAILAISMQQIWERHVLRELKQENLNNCCNCRYPVRGSIIDKLVCSECGSELTGLEAQEWGKLFRLRPKSGISAQRRNRAC